MELSVMSPVLNQMSLEESLAYLSSLGVDSLEIGAGGYPGKAHLDPKEYLANPEKCFHLIMKTVESALGDAHGLFRANIMRSSISII